MWGSELWTDMKRSVPTWGSGTRTDSGTLSRNFELRMANWVSLWGSGMSSELGSRSGPTLESDLLCELAWMSGFDSASMWYWTFESGSTWDSRSNSAWNLELGSR